MDENTTEASRPTPGFRLTKEFGWWLAVILLLGFIGWYKTINLLLLLSYVLASLLLINAYLAWMMSWKVTAHRHAHAPVFALEETLRSMEVCNISTSSCTLSIVESPGHQSWFISGLAAGESTHVSHYLRYQKRGMIQMPAVQIRSEFPIGVVCFERELLSPETIPVLPALGLIDLPMFRRWLIRSGIDDKSTRTVARKQSMSQGEIRGLRGYRTGDSYRDIHWKRSAQRGKLLVREYDQLASWELCLIIDPYLPSDSPNALAETHLEWVLSLAASLAVAWAEAEPEGRLSLILPGVNGMEVKHCRCSLAHLRVTLKDLASIQGTPNVPALSMGSLRNKTHRAARIVISPRRESPLVEFIRQAGLEVQLVTPTYHPTWFQSPEAIRLSMLELTRTEGSPNAK